MTVQPIYPTLRQRLAGCRGRGSSRCAGR